MQKVGKDFRQMDKLAAKKGLLNGKQVDEFRKENNVKVKGVLGGQGGREDKEDGRVKAMVHGLVSKKEDPLADLIKQYVAKDK